VTLWRADARP